MQKRLVRSRDDQMLGGVCAGIGDYLRIDPTWVRLFFVLLAFGESVGIWLYLVLWLILPLEGSEKDSSFESNVKNGAQEIAERARSLGTEIRSGSGPGHRTGWLLGAGLIVLGVVFLIDNLNPGWFSWFRFHLLWPSLLILAGLVILIRRN
ncbi:MAG: PspC domain-containing protein [Anaerolineales bacterium]|jgi:phage shock protein PspC (stress-responsive transcriptional regulator)